MGILFEYLYCNINFHLFTRGRSGSARNDDLVSLVLIALHERDDMRSDAVNHAATLEYIDSLCNYNLIK